MSLSAKLRRAPGRVTTGAFILNSGIGKLSGDDDTAKMVHGMASGAYPVFQKVEPKLFMRALAAGEIVLGGALLLPIVPAAAAGAALTVFSGSLLGMYWRTPGMHKDGSPVPTHQGLPIAKDVWMLGIGANLLADGLLSGAHDKRIEAVHALHDTRVEAVHAVKDKRRDAAQAVKDVRRSVKGTRRGARGARPAVETTRQVVDDTRQAVVQRSVEASQAVRKAAAVNAAKSAALAESARKASKKASKRAQKVSKQARKKISH